MEFGRCCELLKVDVGADASSYTAGGTADSGNLVEWCNEVARGCRFCTHTHNKLRKLLLFLAPLWASVSAALQMILVLAFDRADSDLVRPTLNPPNIQGNFSRLTQGHCKDFATQKQGKSYATRLRLPSWAGYYSYRRYSVTGHTQQPTTLAMVGQP